MRKYVGLFFIQLVKQTYLWTSGIYIRLSNNFAKELATGCPVPTNYNFNRFNSLHIFALIYQTSNDTSEIPACVKQREKGWSALLVEITFFMGAALKSLFDKGILFSSATICWQRTLNFQKPKFVNCVHHIYLYVAFHRHSKAHLSCATFKTFKVLLILWHCF